MTVCACIIYMGVIGIDEVSIIPGVVLYDKKIITSAMILGNSCWCDITHSLVPRSFVISHHHSFDKNHITLPPMW